MMNHSVAQPRRDAATLTGGTDAAPGRHVPLAVAALRRGAPVLLRGATSLIVLAAETAGDEACAAGRAIGAELATLLLAPARAAALLGRPIAAADGVVAIRLTPPMLCPATLRALADPTAPQMAMDLQVIEPPPGALAAFQLAKLARLLPAVVAANAATPVPPGIVAVDAASVLAYPVEAARHLVRVAEAKVPLFDAAETRIVAFRPADGGAEHLAILIGSPETEASPLVRLHSECLTGDLLGSLRCDCGPQLRRAIQRMAEEGHGVLLYLAQEGRGIGLVNKLRAYALQDRGLDTLDANRALGWRADERSFEAAATMLHALGIGRVRLLTNNPEKLAALTEHGIEITGRVSHAIAPNGTNDAYLETKARRFGHLLDG